MTEILDEIFDARVQEFERRLGTETSWFSNKSAAYYLKRYDLVDFGSTYLGVENAQSDLDLLVTTFDCLFDRQVFYNKLESKLKAHEDVSELIIIKGANIPLASFKIGRAKMDLIFADMVSPSCLEDTIPNPEPPISMTILLISLTVR